MEVKISIKTILIVLLCIIILSSITLYLYYSIDSNGNATITIQGQTGRVSHPEIVVDNENNLYVIWEYNLDNYGLSGISDTIYLQKL